MQIKTLKLIYWKHRSFKQINFMNMLLKENIEFDLKRIIKSTVYLPKKRDFKKIWDKMKWKHYNLSRRFIENNNQRINAVDTIKIRFIYWI